MSSVDGTFTLTLPARKSDGTLLHDDDRRELEGRLLEAVGTFTRTDAVVARWADGAAQYVPALAYTVAASDSFSLGAGMRAVQRAMAHAVDQPVALVWHAASGE